MNTKRLNKVGKQGGANAWGNLVGRIIPGSDTPRSGVFGDTAPPAELLEHGKRWWKWAVSELIAMDFLDGSDRCLLEEAAHCYQRLTEARLYTNEHGIVCMNARGHAMGLPSVSMETNMRHQLRQFLADLGLTPIARAARGRSAPAPVDQFEALLNS